MVTHAQLKTTISEFLRVPTEKLSDDTLLTDAVNESFILVEMVMFLQDEYRVRIIQSDLHEVRTVGELIDVFVAKSQQGK